MVLTDEQWVALKAALDAVRPGTGRPLRDERRTVEGVVWRLRNGARWRSVPAEYGPWWRPAQLHIGWSRTGVGAGLFAHLRDAGRPELADVFMGSAVVRAHQKAAGARDKGGPRASGTAARRSAAPAAASRPRPARPATPRAGRSPSPSYPAKLPS
jgi:transposase